MKTFSTPFVVVSAMLAGLTQAMDKGHLPPVERVQGFDWKNPFTPGAIADFQSTCETKVQFEAYEYTLHDLMQPPPKGLKPWAKGLKAVFSNREYPGGWLGMDPHADGRSLLLMNYDQFPLLVREWIEEQERTDGKGKALFAVLDSPKSSGDEIEEVVQFPEANKIDRASDKDKVVIFAPGALYGILPLWAAEASECKDRLVDLSKYSPKPSDGGVVAWVEHSKPEDKKTKLDIKVQALKKKEIKSGHEQGEAKSASREEL
ncbi:hypothetical protein KAF25_010038 [Fusarium avenaceum]|uniref:Uncharacterized protein n=1 Tax=Fusarium avenaceum TaxID=40199 RepID=A0A9P7HGD2_9HYPO|nr:hypothetical protein KAF25_010038 [Fusarium avenaceum]